MITVVGSSNTDFVIKARNIPSRGETVLAEDMSIVPGGKGANQAVAIAKLGGRAAFIARLGNDDFGKRSLKGFRALDINTEYIALDKASPSGLAFIIVDKHGSNIIAVAANSNKRLSCADISRARGMIKKSDFLLLQLEIPRDVARYAISLAHSENIKVILNPAPVRYDLGGDILSKVWLIIPNENEAKALTGINVADIDMARRAANKLLELGPEYAIITLGSRGAILAGRPRHSDWINEASAARADRRNSFHIKSIKVKAIDTTAAGDAFCGALAVALSEGKSVKDSALFANAAAALAVTKLGAQTSLATRKEVDRLLRCGVEQSGSSQGS